MKHSRIIAAAFTVLNVILIIACGIFYFRTDRAKPEFKFSLNDITYNEQTKPEELLDGITASDKRDGDVTDRIVIEKIVESNTESSVVVFYAVSDKTGNVAKISRVFPAVLTKKESTEVKAEETASAAGNDTEAEAGNGDAGAVEDTEIDGDTEGTQDTEADGDAEGTQDTEADGDAEGTQDAEADGDAEGTQNAKAAGDAKKAADAKAAEDEKKAADKKAAEDEKKAADKKAAEDAKKEADAKAAEDAKKEADAKAAEDAKKAADAEAKRDTDAAAETEKADKGEKPVLKLKTSEVTIPAGSGPAWVEIISSLTDDRDSYETLFYNLSVSKYDVNKAGTYKVAVTTKDSDGNNSDPVTLTIHVK